MDYVKYKNKLFNIVMKSVFEDGIYTIIENVLEIIQDMDKMAIININRASSKANETRFIGNGGVPDLLVVSDDFEYCTNKFKFEKQGIIYGCVEAKAPSVDIDSDTNQIKGHIETYKKVIYTNGLTWKFYDYQKSNFKEYRNIYLAYKGDIVIKSFDKRTGVFNKDWIKKEKFGELLYELAKINWENEE